MVAVQLSVLLVSLRLLPFGFSLRLTLAVDGFSVVSGCNLRCIEASKTLNRRVSFHGAYRNHHALPMQVLFSAIPNFSPSLRWWALAQTIYEDLLRHPIFSPGGLRS